VGVRISWATLLKWDGLRGREAVQRSTVCKCVCESVCVCVCVCKTECVGG